MTRSLSRAAAYVVLIALCLSLLAALLPATVAAGDTVTTTQLIDNMQKYDGKVVTLQGEAIGDLLVRGDFAWITVNDDRYSKKSIEEGGELVGMSNSGIGVWVPAAEGRRIGIYGGYKYKGSIVRITGVFHRACEQHGGDTDIHADRVEVMTRGYPFARSFPWAELLTVIILSGVILILWKLRREKLQKEQREE
jgi:membrane protein implicated in regulation of membrane protease activity